mgnify:CR=1 FL=1
MEEQAARLGEVRKSAGWMIVLGILMVLAGVFAVMTPLLMAAWIVVLIGVVLCVGGFAEILHAIRAGNAKLWHFLFGLLGLIAGGIMLLRPGSGFAFFTLILTWFFLIEGVGNIGLSMRMKPQRGWGWMLFSGIVSLLLGVLIFVGWPYSGGLLIGIYTGIYFMFKGGALVALGSLARRAAQEAG